MNKKEKDNLIQKLFACFEQAEIPRFLHKFGPKKYELKQHLLLLLLKQVMKCSYRTICKIASIFGIKAPHFTTLQKVMQRISALLWQKIFSASVKINANIVAIDGTGFSRTNASSYYLTRVDNARVKRCVQLSLIVDTAKKKILALKCRAKPRHEIKNVNCLIKQLKYKPKTFLADKAYDSENLHKQLRQQGILTIIPCKKDAAQGFYRMQMLRNFPYNDYYKRNIIESVFSAIKRRYGSCLLSRKFCTQRAELFCKVILYNLQNKTIEIFY